MRILTVLATLLFSLPAGAATYLYRGQSLSCDYAYELGVGNLDECPSGEIVPGATGRIQIDETKVPGGTLAGLELLITFGSDPGEIPEYLRLARATSPLWFGGADRAILDIGYGRPLPWEDGLLYLRFDEGARLAAYYLGAYIEYDSFISDGGDQIFGFLTRSKGSSTEVVSHYSSEPGRWELSPILVPAAGLLLPLGLSALAVAGRRRSQRREKQ